MFFQEVDKKANRSYGVNQYQMIMDSFPDFSSAYASNFHSAYLLYPFNDPIGETESGIATLSKYKIRNPKRYKLPIDESFPAKFFDLDRCFMVTRFIVDGDRELVLINVHLSAYDEGGVYRAKQWKQLTEFMQYEYDRGNYVVCGGDFNHDIANSKDLFISNTKTAESVYQLSNNDLSENYLSDKSDYKFLTCGQESLKQNLKKICTQVLEKGYDYLTSEEIEFGRDNLREKGDAFKEVILKKLAVIDVATKTASEEERKRLENLKKKYEEVIS
jgi:hypothetical protein